MRVQARSRISRHAWIAVLDTALFVAVLALLDPSDATGYQIHEWVGLGFIVLFVLHVAVSWKWISATWRRLRENPGPRARLNFLLNSALGVMMIVVIVSGLAISAYVLPAVGIHSRDSQQWEQLHNFTSSLVIPVVGLHVALNWIWIKSAFRRYCVAPFRRQAEESGV